MYIKYNKLLKFDFNFINFYPLDSQLEKPIAFVYWFFHDAYGYVRRKGIEAYLEDLYSIEEDDWDYHLVSFSVDNRNNVVYLHETYYEYTRHAKSIEIENFMEQSSSLELCKKNMIEYVVMTKENFGHIIVAYDQILKNDPKFALIYQDDQDWYDVLPFDTEEAMQQFVIDHTKLE